MSTSNVGLSLVVLRNVPLFSGLEEQELERLSRVAVRRRAGRAIVASAVTIFASTPLRTPFR